MDYDGLHQYPDKKIVEETMGTFKWDILSKVLSEVDLLVIKHYWGTEVAFY